MLHPSATIIALPEGRQADCKAQKHQDVESQAQQSEPSADHIAAAAASQPSPGYARAGRGGAGNHYAKTTAADVEDQLKHEAQKTQAAVSASTPSKTRTGLTGRGGAGNWSNSAAAPDADAERHAAEDIQAQILKDVDAGLARPPRAYQQHDREMETTR